MNTQNLLAAERQHSYKVTYLSEDKKTSNTIVGAKNIREAKNQAFSQRRAVVGDLKIISQRVERIYKAN